MSAVSVIPLVFCPPPLGKPDRRQQRPTEGVDTRKRVIQHGSKNNTCSHAAFNMLRERYNAPNTKDLPERKFEQLASSLYKSFSEYNQFLPDVADQLHNDQIKTQFSALTKNQIALLSSPHMQKKYAEIAKKANEKVPLSSVFPDFLKQEKYKNLYEYLVYLKIDKQQDIYNKFFAALNINPRDLFENAKKQDPMAYKLVFKKENWEDLTWEQKTHLLTNFSRQVVAKKFDLEISSWHPKQPIEDLRAELQKHNSLIVGGFFGTVRYATSPDDLGKKIKERVVFGWTKTAPKNTTPYAGHMIVLVGAEKTQKREYVYYIDPEDDSDPLHPEKQRIFCMSYENLTSAKNICDLHGFTRNNAPNSIGYALYRKNSPEKGKE